MSLQPAVCGQIFTDCTLLGACHKHPVLTLTDNPSILNDYCDWCLLKSKKHETQQSKNNRKWEKSLLTFLLWLKILGTTQLPPDQNILSHSKFRFMSKQKRVYRSSMPSHTCTMLLMWYGSQNIPNMTTMARMSFSLWTFLLNLVCLRRLRMST